MSMQQISKDRQCAHPACHCVVKGAEEYCSDYCRMTPGQGDCKCGHSDCAEKGASARTVIS